MINLFTKEHTNENFFAELTKKEFDEDWLKEALKSEFIDINHQDEDGNTFLLKCLKASKFRSSEWLIKHGANIEIKNKAGKSAINIAIEKNSLPVVKGLLELGKIDVNKRDIDGRSLLQNVVVWGNHKMAKLLIQKGANINNTDHHERNVLYDALAFGDRNFIDYLLAFKTLNLNSIDEQGNTILQHPEVKKNDEIAKDLLIAGANSTILTKNEESYLFKTILRGEETLDIIDIALQHGADVNAKTKNGNTIMMEIIKLASELSNDKEDTKGFYLEVALKMLDHGGDINAVGEDSETMLFNAVRLRDFEIIAFLLSGGIDPNIQNEYGETPLFDMVLDGVKSLDLILLLIAYEANPNIKNRHGKTVYEMLNDIIIHQHGTKKLDNPYLLSKIDKNGEYLLVVKEILTRDESDLNYLDSTGNPLFFNALLYGAFPLFRLYINHGLDINTTNQSGHYIFYEYVLKVFEENDASHETLEHFEAYLTALVSHKANKDYQDSLGWTILHKILSTPCNEELFKVLIKVVLFDYTLADNLGRTVIHNAVWGNKANLIEMIEHISPEIINQTDGYGILPITYATLLGNQKLVLLFVNLGSNIHGNKKIAKQAIKKFNPMLKNLPKLLEDINNQTDYNNLQTIIEQTKKDFIIK